MTVSDFIKILRARLNDEAKKIWTDSELRAYINDAITQLSIELLNAKDMSMITELAIIPGTTSVPDGFLRFAGQYPIYISNGTFCSLSGSTVETTVRYWAVKTHVQSNGDNIPFDAALANTSLLNYSIFAAGLKAGYDSQSEVSLAQKATDGLTGKVSVNAEAGK